MVGWDLGLDVMAWIKVILSIKPTIPPKHVIIPCLIEFDVKPPCSNLAPFVF
jgi:hypothetical protein